MKKNLRASCCAALILSAFCFQSLFAQRTAWPPQALSPDALALVVKAESDPVAPENQRRRDAFQTVWQTVRENYFDPNFGGLSWDKIREEFAPRAEQAQTDAELHAILQEMINRLDKSHFVIIPPEIFREIAQAKAAASAYKENEKSSDGARASSASAPLIYGIGIDVRTIENRVVVTRVEKDSPAARAGLRTGFVLEKINGVALEVFLETFRRNSVYARVYENQSNNLIMSLINTETDDGGTLEIAFFDENERPKKAVVKRAPLTGERVKILADLPAQLVTFESRSLSDEIGYVAFNAFALKTVEKFCRAIGEFKNKRALVIDLRGNVGGNFGALYGMLGLLTEQGIFVGTQIGRAGREPRFVRPQPKNFRGKIVVLTDKQSHSSAEIFAAALKENDRATIVGETTAGAALPALTTTLQTGAVFLFPIADFQTPKGNLLEGRGVAPDIKISLDRRTLVAGRDAQLDAAVNFLRAEIKNSATEIRFAKNEKTTLSAPVFGAASFNGGALAAKNLPGVQDEKALKIIDDHIAATGGRESLEKLESLTATGRVEMRQAGAVSSGAVEIFRRTPDKIAKVTRVEGVGEIREVFDGRESFVQTDFMGLQKNDLQADELSLAFNLRELLDARKNYRHINFESSFEKNGRKINLVRAVTFRGSVVYFAFDADAKLLVSRAGTGVSASFGDYRKVGERLFPFLITEGSMTYKLDEIKPNAIVTDEKFAPKADCFSKID